MILTKSPYGQMMASLIKEFLINLTVKRYIYLDI